MEESLQNTKLLDEFLEEDYKELLKNQKKTIHVEEQWSRPGDVIQKLSLYENYTPVRTSGNTTLVSDI